MTTIIIRSRCVACKAALELLQPNLFTSSGHQSAGWQELTIISPAIPRISSTGPTDPFSHQTRLELCAPILLTIGTPTLLPPHLYTKVRPMLETKTIRLFPVYTTPTLTTRVLLTKHTMLDLLAIRWEAAVQHDPLTSPRNSPTKRWTGSIRLPKATRCTEAHTMSMPIITCKTNRHLIYRPHRLTHAKAYLLFLSILELIVMPSVVCTRADIYIRIFSHR